MYRADVTLRPVAGTLQPVAATFQPVAATLQPVAATLHPVAATLRPVVAILRQWRECVIVPAVATECASFGDPLDGSGSAPPTVPKVLLLQGLRLR